LTRWIEANYGTEKNGLEKAYEGAEVTVRMKLGNTESFVTKRSVRQRCVMSPLLFNLSRT